VLQRALDEESGHAAAVQAAERRAARENARADLDACRAVVTEEALREVRAREAALDRRAEELASDGLLIASLIRYARARPRSIGAPRSLRIGHVPPLWRCVGCSLESAPTECKGRAGLWNLDLDLDLDLECKGWTGLWSEPQTMLAISRSRRAHRACLLAYRQACRQVCLQCLQACKHLVPCRGHSHG
jgi:hypothetical protein